MKNNKITAEEQDKTDVVLKERLANENSRQHYVYHQHQADMNVHYVVTLMLLAIENTNGRDIDDFVTKTQVQVIVNTFQCCATQ